MLLGCKGVSIFDIARLGVGLADLLQCILNSRSCAQLTLVSLCTVHVVLFCLVVQAFCAVRSLYTLRQAEPVYFRLLIHAIVKVVFVPVEAGLYGSCIYLHWREDGESEGSAGALGVGVLVLFAVEMYCALGLYSGYKQAGAGVLTPREHQEIPAAVPLKEVVGVPYKPKEKPAQVEFDIPVYDYTNYEERQSSI